MSGFYVVLALGFPGQLGLGGVRFGGLLGLGWLGWPDMMIGTIVAWLLAALVVAVHRPSRPRMLPLAPALIAGFILALPAL
ncbi:hypothetical protein [Ferrimicrobium sp.]|uniref:hypothetical protein n=1 Tax=Ferrimicrobium sp. TaxID=2926050 RepID=UPI0026085CA1|nr:hypothetical protein [Ferrimicrobium sp.]